MPTLIEEVRSISSAVSSEEDRLLARAKEDIIAHSKLGHHECHYSWQTLSYLFAAVMREDGFSQPHSDNMGAWQFQNLLRKLNDVLIAEGFKVEAIFTDYMDIDLKVTW